MSVFLHPYFSPSNLSLTTDITMLTGYGSECTSNCKTNPHESAAQAASLSMVCRLISPIWLSVNSRVNCIKFRNYSYVILYAEDNRIDYIGQDLHVVFFHHIIRITKVGKVHLLVIIMSLRILISLSAIFLDLLLASTSCLSIFNTP